MELFCSGNDKAVKITRCLTFSNPQTNFPIHTKRKDKCAQNILQRRILHDKICIAIRININFISYCILSVSAPVRQTLRSDRTYCNKYSCRG